MTGFEKCDDFDEASWQDYKLNEFGKTLSRYVAAACTQSTFVMLEVSYPALRYEDSGIIDIY